MNNIKLSGTVGAVSDRLRLGDPSGNDYHVYRYLILNHEDKFTMFVRVEGEIIAEVLSRYYEGEHIEVEGKLILDIDGYLIVAATSLTELDPKPPRPVPESEMNDRLMDG